MPSDAHEKVVRLYVAVDEVLVVYKLNATYHLVGEHQNRLHREAPRAEIEQVLKARSQKVHHQDIVIALLAVPRF